MIFLAAMLGLGALGLGLILPRGGTPPAPAPAPPAPAMIAKADMPPREEPPAADPIAARVIEGPALSTAEIVARSEPSVALIRGSHSHGTGFLARPGIVVTNAHVVRGELIESIEVHFPGAGAGLKGPHPARLLDIDAPRDLAILKVATELPPLRLAEAYAFRKGEDVTIIGSPGVGGAITLENAVTQGVLSTQTMLGGRRFYQLGAAVNPGNSGGPAIDSHGSVIGVVTATARKEQAIGFCVPVDDALALLTHMDGSDVDARLGVERRHTVETVAHRLLAVGSGSIAVLELYLKAIDAAIAQGASPQRGLEQARRALDESAARPELFLSREVEVALNKLDLVGRSRQGVEELHALTVELAGLAQAPRGTLDGFRAKVVDLRARFNASARRVEADLNLDLSE